MTEKNMAELDVTAESSLAQDSSQSATSNEATENAQAAENAQNPQPRRQNRPDVSVPSVSSKITLNSIQAQKAFNRSFSRASASMYRVEVILRIIGSEENASAVEAVVDSMINELQAELSEEMARYEILIEDNGIDSFVEYSNAVTHEIQIPSPQVSKFVRIIKTLDRLMYLQDTMWLSGLFASNKERNDNAFKFQQKVIGLGARIIGIERQARESARRQGMTEELNQVVPEQDDGSDLAEE